MKSSVVHHAISMSLRAAAFVAVLCAPTVCLSQATTTPAPQPKEPLETMGVGIAGGIIAGAELSLLVESFADVEPVWPWIVFPILTGAGGGVGGYFLDKNAPEGAIAVLVTSMALLIPTAIAVSVARSYEPAEGVKLIDEGGERKYSFEEDPAPPTTEGAEPETVTEVEARPEEIPEGTDAPPAETEPEPAPEGGASARLEQPTWARHLASGSLLHVDDSFGVGVPSIDVRPVTFSDEAALAARTGLEIRLSLLRIDLP
ncbi:MAG: hypothetical protein M0R80_20820 [Proteobacteria bacterium]|jgi:hypothetical protein|nr:hypothetical protein [Pseudomonadota bacterium]